MTRIGRNILLHNPSSPACMTVYSHGRGIDDHVWTKLSDSELIIRVLSTPKKVSEISITLCLPVRGAGNEQLVLALNN